MRTRIAGTIEVLTLGPNVTGWVSLEEQERDRLALVHRGRPLANTTVRRQLSASRKQALQNQPCCPLDHGLPSLLSERK